MRINKLLSNRGFCSRKEANRFIGEKRILVNGELCMPGQWVEEEDEILIDGQIIPAKQKVYVVLNKPVGITCTAAKEVEENIIDFIKFGQYIFPVGRLDKQSQGLILMTNDGELANKVLDAENEHEKEYLVTLDKEYDENFIDAMAGGVNICGVITKPCKLMVVDSRKFNIILTQGLNKQIRRMCKNFGYKVERLERIRIVNIEIKGLGLGEWRNLTEEELIELRKL